MSGIQQVFYRWWRVFKRSCRGITMASTTQARTIIAPNYKGPRFFGAPVGDFSFFQTILISAALGVAAFFAATFCAIMTILVLTQAAHMKINFADAYKFVGLPVGIVVLVAASIYLGSLLVMRLRNQKSNI
jgi:hypothetical protein